MGVPSASQASPMPSMAWENCHMTSGFSGLPKLRQFVAAMGSGRGEWAIVNGAFFGERMRGNLRGDCAVISYNGQATISDRADDDGVESPLLKNVEDFAFAALFGDEQHALLRFAEHDFVRRHAGFALGNFGEVNFNAGAAARRHFHGGAGEAGGAHVL